MTWEWAASACWAAASRNEAACDSAACAACSRSAAEGRGLRARIGELQIRDDALVPAMHAKRAPQGGGERQKQAQHKSEHGGLRDGYSPQERRAGASGGWDRARAPLWRMAKVQSEASRAAMIAFSPADSAPCGRIARRRAHPGRRRSPPPVRHGSARAEPGERLGDIALDEGDGLGSSSVQVATIACSTTASSAAPKRSARASAALRHRLRRRSTPQQGQIQCAAQKGFRS